MDFYSVIRKSAVAAAMAAVLLTAASAAEIEQVRQGIMGVYDRKRAGGETVLNTLSPGDPNSDWLAAAVGEYGIADDYQGYLDRLAAFVAEKYAAKGGLDKNKVTEWHRVALTVKALGGDPTAFGGVDLLKDGITEPIVRLNRQGINGLIWAAIAAQECGAEFSGELTLEEICDRIVGLQNPDGGFSLRGDSDPDVTAMAIRALCGVQGYRPYAELARAALRDMRLPDGGYASGGVENSESTAQVIMALCAMGEQPHEEVDVLLSYRNPDGGFAHTLGGESDDMASVQAMLALIAYEESLAAASAESEDAAETAAAEVTAEPAIEDTPIDEVGLEEVRAEEDGLDAAPEAAPIEEVNLGDDSIDEISLDGSVSEGASAEESSPEEAHGLDDALPVEETASAEELPAGEDEGRGDVAAILSAAGVAILAVAAWLLSKRLKKK